MLFIVSFAEKKLQRLLQVGIMESENASEATQIVLKYHSIRTTAFDQSDVHKVNIQTNKFVYCNATKCSS